MDRWASIVGSRRTSLAVVLLGCGLRLFHYLRDPSLWHDEAALVVNVLTHDFGALLGPLEWNETGPPLFLWLERTVALLLGDSTYALRLVPVLASCLSLFLFAATTRRLLSARPAFWAVLLFAASDRLTWHAVEAKPYAVDVFVACLTLFAAVRWQSWPLARRLILFAVVSPIAIFLSFPACFVCGALLLFMLPEAWRSGWRQRTLFAAWAIGVVGAFAVLYFGPVQAQRNGALEGCWLGHFPTWSQPWRVPIWSVANTCEVVRYCFKPFGNLLAPVAVVGAVVAWQNGQRRILLLLAGPLGLAWVAALMHGYPYGGSRLEVFAAPGLAILLAVGAETVRNWCRARWRFGSVAVAALMLTPLGETVRFAIVPWPRADAAGAAGYILAKRQAGELLAANHWEYAYYFRRQIHDSGELALESQPHEGRVWMAFSTPDRGEHRRFRAAVAGHGQIVERKKFAFTSVYLIEWRREPD